ncbi:hypothetical protein C8R44DRAFT_866545 [Mycena epipterygia]|nr:hypothetical protein C8R44DRAFT_866545 [Mycena epipterygia]
MSQIESAQEPEKKEESSRWELMTPLRDTSSHVECKIEAKTDDSTIEDTKAISESGSMPALTDSSCSAVSEDGSSDGKGKNPQYTSSEWSTQSDIEEWMLGMQEALRNCRQPVLMMCPHTTHVLQPINEFAPE